MDVTNDLQVIKRRRKVVRIFRAERDAVQVVVCLQRLKRALDMFLVGNDNSMLAIELCLSILQVESAAMIEKRVGVRGKTWPSLYGS